MILSWTRYVSVAFLVLVGRETIQSDGSHSGFASALSSSQTLTGTRIKSQYESSVFRRNIPKSFMVASSTTATTATTDGDNGKEIPSASPLADFDPEIANLISLEDRRQRVGLELIASENFVSAAVREALGSCLTNKYSEGMVGKRYYGGNEYIDLVESLCQSRALSLYNLSSEEWGVNVQPYSGSPANFAVYTALLEPHDRIMGLDLPSGGHLTHGFQTAKKKVSATSVYFESMPYVVDQETGYIDYDDMERRAKMFLPKLLIAGGSAYPREWDYARMKQIADSVGAIFMVDMAHISGLVAGQCVDNPFEYADVVTSTTHKTLRGPRSGMIFSKKEMMDKIDSAVFPSLQGGPHNHQIGALAVALKEANTPEFIAYTQSILSNSQALAKGLNKRGHVLATGGTDNHLMLWDVRSSLGLTGSKVEKVLEMASITTNKNSIPGDTSALNPGGVRLGTAALTTRGLDESDFDKVAEFLDRGGKLAQQIQNVAKLNMQMAQKENPTAEKKKVVTLKYFLETIENNEEVSESISQLKKEVEDFAIEFEMPGDK
jgi:glycine hydroxymethyltransferase